MWWSGVAGSTVAAVIWWTCGVNFIIVLLAWAAFNYATTVLLDLLSGKKSHASKRPGRAPRAKTIRREDP